MLKSYFLYGNRYLLAENLEQAEAHFLRAIEVSPREVEPYLRLADIYVEQDEIDRALEILEQGQEAVAEADQELLVQKEEEIREEQSRSSEYGQENEEESIEISDREENRDEEPNETLESDETVDRVMISAGVSHTVVLENDNTIWAWGEM